MKISADYDICHEPIDMVSEPLRPMLKDAQILNAAVHSDHCPMMLNITY